LFFKEIGVGVETSRDAGEEFFSGESVMDDVFEEVVSTQTCVMTDKNERLSDLQSQKIGKEFLAVRCQNRFGMELHTPKRQILVPQGHDFPLGGLCRDLKAVRETLPANQEAVISGCLKRIGKSLKEILSIMKDR
jgi:hypothetical protein